MKEIYPDNSREIPTGPNPTSNIDSMMLNVRGNAMTKKRLTLKQAIQFINELKGIEGEDWVKPQTIYKKTCEGKLHNFGSRNKGLYDRDELIREFGVPISA